MSIGALGSDSMAEMAIADVSELREQGLGKYGHTPQAISLFYPELEAEVCSPCGG